MPRCPLAQRRLSARQTLSDQVEALFKIQLRPQLDRRFATRIAGNTLPLLHPPFIRNSPVCNRLVTQRREKENIRPDKKFSRDEFCCFRFASSVPPTLSVLN